MQDNKRDWEILAQLDPLWAISTLPHMKFNKWNIEQFFLRGEKLNNELMEEIKQIGYPTAFKTAMDLGCGVGRISRFLAKNFEECYGVDISETMVELAKKYNHEIFNCKFVVNSGKNLSMFSENYFNLVYSRIVLQHIPEKEIIKNYIREFIRILKKKGLLYFQLPSHVPIRSKIRPIHRIYTFPFAFLQCFNIFSYKKESFNMIADKFSHLFPEINLYYDKMNRFYEKWKIKKLYTYDIRKILSNFLDYTLLNRYFAKFEFESVKNVNYFFELIKSNGYLDIFDQYLKIGFEYLNKNKLIISQSNLPFENIAFYKKCEDKVIDIFSNIDGILSIYKFGTVKAIGNSDIDFCFVIDNNKCKFESIIEVFDSRFNDDEKYLIFQHSPFVFTESLFPKMHIIRPATDLVLIHGKDIKPVEKDLNFDYYFRLYTLVELLCSLHSVNITNHSKLHTDIRLAFQHMNALKFVFQLYLQICNENNSPPIIKIADFKNFIKDNNFYRKSMFIFSKKALILQINRTYEYYFEFINNMKIQIANILKITELHDFTHPKYIEQIKNSYFISNYEKLYTKKLKCNRIKLEFNPIEFYYFFEDNLEIFNAKLNSAINIRRNLLNKYLKLTESHFYKRLFTPFHSLDKLSLFSKLFISRKLKLIKISNPFILLKLREIYHGMAKFIKKFV